MKLLYHLYCLAFCRSYLEALGRADEWLCEVNGHDYGPPIAPSVSVRHRRCLRCGMHHRHCGACGMRGQKSPVKPPSISTIVHNPQHKGD